MILNQLYFKHFHNIERSSMEMGKLVSTCNLLKKGATEVTVENSDPILWTMSHTLIS